LCAYVSVVVPTFNEKDNIPLLFEELSKSLNAMNFEVVVIDDSSPDETWLKAVEEIEKGSIKGIVVKRVGFKGLATAVLDGIHLSKGEIVVVMDADLQHPPKYVPKLVNSLIETGCDLAIGTRYAPGGGVENWRLYRVAISKLATLIAKLLLPEARRISDPMSGFFAIRKSVVTTRREVLNPIGYKILLEIISKCRLKCIVEVPYIFRARARGKSKLGLRQILNFVLHVLTLSGWRPVKFAIVGALGTIVNLGTLLLLSLLAPALTSSMFVLGSAIAIEVSTLFNFLLHEKWTFRDRKVGSKTLRLLKFHGSVLPAITVQYLAANIIKYGFNANAILSQFIGIVLGFLVNYILSELKVWKGRRLEVHRMYLQQ